MSNKTSTRRTTVTVALKKGPVLTVEDPEVYKVEGTILTLGESSRAMRLPLDTITSITVAPRKPDVVDELMKLYTDALKRSPYSAYTYNTSLRW
ncbi:hypothetical protein [Glycomyces buryatensis]|uniref:Uncharacterized protein n=1 Tax=Glycomyces buryatensis TaxID=2570927 RepID=A0A4S8Q8E8_9ACTN|nr:hypothetical protein [Glycomyces buryatensis]THV39661.1 hypothetical protein FAB82_17485 [Glycomyces buryatensis]